jgi:hypothetical protein
VTVTVAPARKTRVLVLTAALLAVFLGALDALIIGAAVGEGVEAVFRTALLVSFLSIIMGEMLPERKIVQ